MDRFSQLYELKLQRTLPHRLALTQPRKPKRRSAKSARHASNNAKPTNLLPTTAAMLAMAQMPLKTARNANANASNKTRWT